MTLEELLIDLSHGELSNLSMALSGAGGIEETQMPKAVLAINSALLRLYTRFSISTKEVLVEQVEGITRYELSSKYAESSYDPVLVKYPYIKDTPQEPFENDVIRVLEVYDSLWKKLPLNDQTRRDSVFTPNPFTVQVPHVMPGVALGIKYQAKHPPLSVETLGSEISIPAALEEALRAFAGYSIFHSMNTAEAMLQADKLLIRFEGLCADVENQGLFNSNLSTTESLFEKRGWV